MGRIGAPAAGVIDTVKSPFASIAPTDDFACIGVVATGCVSLAVKADIIHLHFCIVRVTYYTAGKSLAVFFGNAGNSSQNGLIRMGRITSDLNLFANINDSVTVTITLAESDESVKEYDFSVFRNVEITGIDPDILNDEELSVLYVQARYCQAMTDADIETMREIVSEDMVFTHMSGMQQTREQYFADIASGRLNYYTIGIEEPEISVAGNKAEITFTSVLNANAYGARGTYRIKGTHHYENRNGKWIAGNGRS